MADLSVKIADFNSYFSTGSYHSAKVLLTEITHEFIGDLYPISPPGKKDPKYLIHYTSLETLFSMLDRKEPDYLRLYDTIHSNDPTEGVFFRDQIKQISSSLYSNLPPFILNRYPGYAYIASFVRANHESARDKLIYWLAYRWREGRRCLTCLSEAVAMMKGKGCPGIGRGSRPKSEAQIRRGVYGRRQ